MNAINLNSLLLRNLETIFALSGQLAKTCTFFKTQSNAGTGLTFPVVLDSRLTMDSDDVSLLSGGSLDSDALITMDSDSRLVSLALCAVAVTAIFVPYHSSDIDGSAVIIGDEKCFVRAADLVNITSPGGGDNLVETVTGLRRNVIASRLDPVGTFWTLQVRRAGNEDWGALTAATADEDYGDLSPTPLFDDYQN